MSTVSRTAGTAGSITLTTKNTAGQLIVPVSVPTVVWYTDAARTLGALALAVTGSGSTYTATWTAGQAPSAASTRYLKVTIEVSAAVFDTDADDSISFVDAGSELGNAYLTVAQVRALPNLNDPAKFTDAEIAAAIAWFEETFESYTGVAWVPRTRTVTVEPYRNGTLQLSDYLPRRITAVRTYTAVTTYTDFTVADLDGLILEASGLVRRWGAYFTYGSRVVVTYEHGYDSPPVDVVEAAKVAVRDHLLTDNSGNRQFATVTQEGIVRTSTPGADRPFGIPFCDAVANRRSMTGSAGSVAIG